MADARLQRHEEDLPAQIRYPLSRREFSPLELVELILGKWLNAEILPLVNINLRTMERRVSKPQRKYYKPCFSSEFLRFILKRMLGDLIKKEKHSISPSALEELMKSLMGIHRHNVLSSSLTFGARQLDKIFKSVPKIIQDWVALGTIYCIDESIFPFFGRAAFEQGLLQLIPNKPHDYGLVTYFMSQRLLFTSLPIAIDLVPTWIGTPPKPLDAAIYMLRRNRVPDQHQHLITDNLWAAPSHFLSYLRLGIRYTMSVKTSPGGDLTQLIALASTDLPTGKTRTYARDDQVLQVTQVEDHITIVISNAWSVKDLPLPHIRPRGTYASADALFKNETAAGLCDMFDLGDAWLTEQPKDIIFYTLGWDVTRPANNQDQSTLLDRAACQKLKVRQLRPIFMHHTKLRHLPANISKPKMLSILFGDESETEESEPKTAKRKREVADLGHLRDQVRGTAEEGHSVYDVWLKNWNDVDRINEDYHAHYYSPGHRTATKQGLESVVFVMLMNARAFYEEHLCARAFHKSDHRKSAVPFARRYTIPEFIVKVAQQLIAK